jgi:hypothetical protein
MPPTFQITASFYVCLLCQIPVYTVRFSPIGEKRHGMSALYVRTQHQGPTAHPTATSHAPLRKSPTAASRGKSLEPGHRWASRLQREKATALPVSHFIWGSGLPSTCSHMHEKSRAEAPRLAAQRCCDSSASPDACDICLLRNARWAEGYRRFTIFSVRRSLHY